MFNSNLGSIFHRFRDMVSFLLKTHIFPLPFNPNVEYVFFALDRWNFARLAYT